MSPENSVASDQRDDKFKKSEKLPKKLNELNNERSNNTKTV